VSGFKCADYELIKILKKDADFEKFLHSIIDCKFLSETGLGPRWSLNLEGNQDLNLDLNLNLNEI
jgi:hypothetical protein